jgi:glucan phosphoethanolaminetransferase (alkaline phosphatase superfamily)
MERRAAVSAKIGEFADKVPGVGYVKNKLPGQLVKGLGNTLNINKSDGFITMIVKWFLNLISTIIGSPMWPTYIRALFGINFILAYAQTMPIFGGIIQAALEMTTFVITTTGTTILSLGNMGGPAGHIIGLMFASIFFILSALISYSRQQFTDALIVSANLIPFVGAPISAALQRADIAASKLTEAAKKVHNSFLDLVAAVFDIKGKVHTGGIRFSRRRKNTKKWRTRRSRFARL